MNKITKIPSILAGIVLSISSASVVAQDCNYKTTKGEEFEFGKIHLSGQKYGYMLWMNQPVLTTNFLSYQNYVGRKGKLTFEYVSFLQEKRQWRKVLLENCEIVYLDAKSNAPSINIYLKKDVDRARNLIGKSIWIDQSLVSANPLTLATADKNTSYSLNDHEEVMVVDVVLDSYGHTFGSGPFYLKVRKASGEEGVIKYFSAYFYERKPVD